MAKQPLTPEEMQELTGIEIPLNTIDDAMLWLAELARRTARGEMLVDPAEQCRRAVAEWVKAWQAKEKADPASVAKRAFTSEMAARAARELSAGDAKRALMGAGISMVIEILEPQRLDTPEIEKIPMLEVRRDDADAAGAGKKNPPLQLDNLF